MIPAAEGHCRWSSARIACRRIQGPPAFSQARVVERDGAVVDAELLDHHAEATAILDPGTEGAGTGCARDQADAAGVRRQDER